MKWKYYRVRDHQASKWVSGNNWVTKYDDEGYCYIGINGKRVDGHQITDPKQARRYVELRQPR